MLCSSQPAAKRGTVHNRFPLVPDGSQGPGERGGGSQRENPQQMTQRHRLHPLASFPAEVWKSLVLQPLSRRRAVGSVSWGIGRGSATNATTSQLPSWENSRQRADLGRESSPTSSGIPTLTP